MNWSFSFSAGAAALLAVAVLSPTLSPAADITGAKDHPILKRYEGSQIVAFNQQAFDEYAMALGKHLNAAVNEGRTIEKENKIRGKVTRISYVVPEGRSALEVFTNYEDELKAQGFEILWSATGDDTGYDMGKRYPGVGGQLFEYSSAGSCYVAARLKRPEGEVAVAVFVAKYQDGYVPNIEVKRGQTIVQVDVVEAKPMDQKMVTVTAEEMATGLNTQGKISLYGIYFDTNKAVVKPESAPTLDEIAKLLKTDPTLKLLVVGHTDTVGGFESNRALSEKRAAAVAQELQRRHGISTERLFSFGVSYASPAASNETEAGRALNRRVELVKM